MIKVIDFVSIKDSEQDFSLNIQNELQYEIGNNNARVSESCNVEYLNTSSFISDMQSCDAFIVMAHGGNFGYDTGIQINDVGGNSTPVIIYGSDISNTDLSNLKIAVFLSCSVGGELDNRASDNLIEAVVAAGADVAIGFNRTIYTASAKSWILSFFNALINNYTVEDALEIASVHISLDCVEACGDLNASLFE